MVLYSYIRAPQEGDVEKNMLAHYCKVEVAEIVTNISNKASCTILFILQFWDLVVNNMPFLIGFHLLSEQCQFWLLFEKSIPRSPPSFSEFDWGLGRSCSVCRIGKPWPPILFTHFFLHLRSLWIQWLLHRFEIGPFFSRTFKFCLSRILKYWSPNWPTGQWAVKTFHKLQQLCFAASRLALLPVALHALLVLLALLALLTLLALRPIQRPTAEGWPVDTPCPRNPALPWTSSASTWTARVSAALPWRWENNRDVNKNFVKKFKPWRWGWEAGSWVPTLPASSLGSCQGRAGLWSGGICVVCKVKVYNNELNIRSD